ncbi:MAG: OmpH family outer membrane protein [Mariprofundaceae bacterium]|nr:OmpH family outer membrane protein [Mariprofundaceae bacterium]
MKKMLLMLGVMALFLSAQVVAAETKIAYVDIKTAMENTKAYKQGIKRLEALQKKKKKELEVMRNRLSEMDKKLQMQSMAMSNNAQMAEQQALTRLKKEFERKLQDAGDELKSEKRKLDQTLIGRFYDAVRAYGKSNQVDLILPKSATIYANTSLDITSAITKALDKK